MDAHSVLMAAPDPDSGPVTLAEVFGAYCAPRENLTEYRRARAYPLVPAAEADFHIAHTLAALDAAMMAYASLVDLLGAEPGALASAAA